MILPENDEHLLILCLGLKFQFCNPPDSAVWSYHDRNVHWIPTDPMVHGHLLWSTFPNIAPVRTGQKTKCNSMANLKFFFGKIEEAKVSTHKIEEASELMWTRCCCRCCCRCCRCCWRWWWWWWWWLLLLLLLLSLLWCCSVSVKQPPLEASGFRSMEPGNDEREQTVNQLLTEMDGFEGNKASSIRTTSFLISSHCFDEFC